MKFPQLIAVLVVLFVLSACDQSVRKTESDNHESLEFSTPIHYESEHQLKNIAQLTNGGDNAEAYWSFDNSMLVFQSNFSEWGVNCDQIFTTDLSSDDMTQSQPKMVSTGLGRTTCSYFLPGDTSILYASTHLADSACPPPPTETSGKYVWPIYPGFDIFVSDLSGNITQQLTSHKGYDAEATVSPQGDKIVFTSMRTGDLELFTMNIDGTDVQQITDELGYDGGAFFSPDGSQLIFRASRPKTEEEISTYKELLANNLVMPTNMELFICDANGSNLRQLTDLGNANWCPFFHPSGKKVIFSSNYKSKRGFPFNLYLINTDGTGLEQVTHDETFDAFPVFSPDGKYLAFSSNRNNGGTRATNLFVAEWAEINNEQ